MAIIVFHNDNLLKHLIIECIWPYSESFGNNHNL